MEENPISISWDDLNTRKVEQRLREQQAMTRNRAYARMDAQAMPVSKPARASLLNNTLVVMAMMGLMGGLLAWPCGFLTQLRPAEQTAVDLAQGIQRHELNRTQGIETEKQANDSIDIIRGEGEGNAYFAAVADPKLSASQRAARLTDLQHRAEFKRFAINALSLGLAGMLLALCLGLAEPLSDRNIPHAVRNGALGAVLGMLGGVGVAFFVDRLYRSVAGVHVVDPEQFTARDVFARSVAWGVLGLFLAAGPGLLLGNFKKTLIGLAGGLIGGAIGGALYEPVSSAAGPDISRLVAFCTIGLLTGLGTALIENVAKAGWLKVTSGLIAGKQFILYRNPTFIGSAPECQIYLFRDPSVGRRHAALHLVPGGIELEDLPLGQSTLVNNQPVERTRLRHGDTIAIGGTTFLFQEKERSRK